MQIMRPTSRIPSSFWKADDTLESFMRQLTRRLAPNLEMKGAWSEWMPIVEVIESDDELVLTAELPGLEQNDVELELSDDMLVIRGSKEDRKEKKEHRYRVWERTYGSFERAFTLPANVELDGIQADMDNGVLTVHMPKIPAPAARKIEIEKANA